MIFIPPITHLSVRVMKRARHEGLLEAVLDAPLDGGTSDAWAVRVRGHLLGATSPVREVEAVVPGAILASGGVELPTPEVAARHPGAPGAGSCGFTLLVDTLGLPRQFEFRLRVTLADGSRAKVAVIAGQRQPLVADYAPRLQPLLVTSLGRMGTTLLMQMLAAHPGIVAYARPPYEARGGKYWLHVLKTLAAPADASKQIGAAMEFHREPLATGGNPFYSGAFAAWPRVEAWSGAAYIADLAAFCQRSIDGWYLATAAAQGQAEAPLVYFAEKHFPDDYPRRLRELYPSAKELFLMRDFRDMIASMIAYNARKGFGDFGRETAVSDDAWFAELRQGVVALIDGWRERGEPGTLVRYEDLVRDPLATLPPLLTSLGLDAAPETVARLIVAAAPDAPELRGHGTADSPAASIGRWRRDLSPAMRERVDAIFGELLLDLGYTREPATDC
ncbi:MAG: sulfotransferase [Chloroflexia bacterium]|nr:sulfotransferase [Chloroflexia bacterium]